MAKRREGLRFLVLINGRRACVSGMDGYGVPSAVLSLRSRISTSIGCGAILGMTRQLAGVAKGGSRKVRLYPAKSAGRVTRVTKPPGRLIGR